MSIIERNKKNIMKAWESEFTFAKAIQAVLQWYNAQFPKQSWQTASLLKSLTSTSTLSIDKLQQLLILHFENTSADNFKELLTMMIDAPKERFVIETELSLKKIEQDILLQEHYGTCIPTEGLSVGSNISKEHLSYAIENAKAEIIMSSFQFSGFKDNEALFSSFQTLSDKAKRENRRVNIFILSNKYLGLGGLFKSDEAEQFSNKIRNLKHLNVAYLKYEFKWLGSNHSKFYIVDRQKAFFPSSVAIDDSSEFNLMTEVEGKAIALDCFNQFKTLCQSPQVKASNKKDILKALNSKCNARQAQAPENSPMLLLTKPANGGSGDKNNLSTYMIAILSLIKNAKTSIQIMLPEFENELLLQTLKVAINRNVKIEILSPKNKNNVYFAAKYFKTVQNENFTFRWFVDQNNMFKESQVNLIIVDNRYAVKGSSTWSNESLYHHGNFDLIVDDENYALHLGRIYQEQFENGVEDLNIEKIELKSPRFQFKNEVGFDFLISLMEQNKLENDPDKFSRKRNYTVIYKNQTYQVRLSHSLLQLNFSDNKKWTYILGKGKTALLGAGRYGRVKTCEGRIDLNNKKVFKSNSVVKIISRLKNDWHIEQEAEAWRDILGPLSASFILKRNKKCYFSMMEQKGKTVADWLKEDCCIEEKLNLVYKIIKALQHANQQGYIFHDLKTDNIIINDNGDVTLIDYGHAWKIGSNQVAMSHKYNYCAPEAFNTLIRNEATDVFSLGCVIAEVLGTGKLDMWQQMRNMRKHFAPKIVADVSPWLITSEIATNIDDDSRELIVAHLHQMTNRNPAYRPTIEGTLTLFEDFRYVLDEGSEDENAARANP